MLMYFMLYVIYYSNLLYIILYTIAYVLLYYIVLYAIVWYCIHGVILYNYINYINSNYLVCTWYVMYYKSCVYMLMSIISLV